MALQKQIELENGIITNYHRILSINNLINQETQIIVVSYANQSKREQEEENPEENKVIASDMITKNYEENLTIENAYNYLKTLDKFKNAEDC